MILDKQKQEELLEAARPLIKWLNQNANNYCSARVEDDSVLLEQGISYQFTDEYLPN